MSTDARTLIRRAIEAIDELQHREDFPGIDRVEHVLNGMLLGIDARNVPERPFRHSGLARLVTDAWPMGEPVTRAVIEAETAYLGLP